MDDIVVLKFFELLSPLAAGMLVLSKWVRCHQSRAVHKVQSPVVQMWTMANCLQIAESQYGPSRKSRADSI